MFDSEKILSELAELDSIEAYTHAAQLHWRIENLADAKAREVVLRLVPDVAELSCDTDSEYGDSGDTYFVYNGSTLTLKDGRTVDLPDESQLSSGEFEEGNCGPEISAEAIERIDAAVDADPTLERIDLLIAEVGRPLGLDAEQTYLLIDVTSFLSRSNASEGGVTFSGPASSDPGTAPSPAVSEG